MQVPRVSNPVTREGASHRLCCVVISGRRGYSTPRAIRVVAVVCAFLAADMSAAACVPATAPLPVTETASAAGGAPERGAGGELQGEWGGEHIRLVVTEAGAKAEFDCAVGVIEEPIRPDAGGRFEAHGVFMYERGGPSRRDDPPLPRHPALYRGETDGKAMTLTVVLTESKKEMGPFALALGRPAALEKCL